MKNNNTKLIGLVASLILAAGTVFGFFWLWTQMQAEDTTANNMAVTAPVYTQVEISTVKKEAEDILSGKTKFSSIPVKAPTDKVGRDNPFTDVK